MYFVIRERERERLLTIEYYKLEYMYYQFKYIYYITPVSFLYYQKLTVLLRKN